MNNTGIKTIRRSLRLFLSLIWLIALFHLPSVSAIQRPFPTADDLALEIPDYNKQPAYYPVHPTSAGMLTFYNYEKIKDWQPPQTPFTMPTAIQLAYRREGEAIKIEAVVLLGPFDRQDTPRSFKGVPTETFGSYSIRLNESVSLQELTRWGIVPITIKVVPAKSPNPNPARIENKTTAIEVVSVDEARNVYLLKLKNTSAKPVLALSISVPTPTINGGQLLQGFPERPLIAPGQTHEVHVAIGRSGRSTPQGFVPDEPQPPRIVIAGVVFTDSTFEGEIETALYVAANKRGEKIQGRRLIGLLQAAKNALEQDRQKVIERLREQIGALSEEPDERVVNEIAKAFAPLTKSQREQLRSGLQSGLNTEKQRLLYRLKEYEQEENAAGTNLQEWLSQMKTQFEEMIGKP